MAWEPIHRGKPEVLGVNVADTARLDVRISLDAAPPAEWSALFLSPTRLRVDPAMKAPEIDGQVIWIRPPDAELAAYVGHVDERIAGANQRYEQDVLPRLRIQQPRDLDTAAHQDQRVEQARRRAERL
jgi:hypothetical protein